MPKARCLSAPERRHGVICPGGEVVGTQTPLKAIRRHCLDCMRDGMTMTDFSDSLDPDILFYEPPEPPSQRAVKQAVKMCPAEECSLWEYRMGRRLRREG
jgi:hypothetical protein